MLIIGKKKIQPIDLLSDKFLFGHRIELGKLIASGEDNNLIDGVMFALYEVKIRPIHYPIVYNHVKEVLEKLKVWTDKERALEYVPTPEEREAGINVISEKVKEFATIDAIATRMHISHNDALALPYSIVFLMLQKDLEQSKFERRLNKIYERKYKK